MATALTGLRDVLAEDPDARAVAAWIDQWLQLRENFRRALDGHVLAWQTLLGDCSLMPGQAPLTSTGTDAVGAANDDAP